MSKVSNEHTSNKKFLSSNETSGEIKVAMTKHC